jgi:hypothetical protein
MLSFTNAVLRRDVKTVALSEGVSKYIYERKAPKDLGLYIWIIVLRSADEKIE